MPHFAGQHDARPAVLSDEQFAELKELLAPGHELATLMLADYKAQRDAALVDHSGDKAEGEPKKTAGSDS